MSGNGARSSSENALGLRQRVAGRQHQHVLPLVARQAHQFGQFVERFGGEAEVGHLFVNHFCHIGRRALVQADRDLGKAPAHLRHRPRQEVARLAVRGGDRQRARILLRELVADALQVGHLAQDDLHRLQHFAPRLGDAAQPLAVAGEDVDAELAFEFQDCFRHAGLRREERLGRFGQVEVAADGFLNEPELVEVHGRPIERSRGLFTSRRFHRSAAR